MRTLYPLSGMMITIITVPPTCHHQQEAEDEAVEEVILIRLIIMDMKTITITMDIITTTTGAATMTRTMAMRTSKHLGEEEEQEESVVVPIRPGAVVLSPQGVEWASPNEEASEQSEVNDFFLCDHPPHLHIFTLCFLFSNLKIHLSSVCCKQVFWHWVRN